MLFLKDLISVFNELDDNRVIDLAWVDSLNIFTFLFVVVTRKKPFFTV